MMDEGKTAEGAKTIFRLRRVTPSPAPVCALGHPPPGEGKAPYGRGILIDTTPYARWPGNILEKSWYNLAKN